MQLRGLVLIVLFSGWMAALTMHQAVQQGLKRDPRIQMLRQDYSIALNEIKMAKGNYLPTVDADGFLGKEYSKLPTSKDSTRLLAKHLSITGKINIFNGGKDKYILKEKRVAAKLARNRLEEGKMIIAQEISMAYLDMLKRYKTYQKSRHNLLNYESTLKKIKLKVRDGGGKDSDLAQAQSRKNYEKANVLAAKQAFLDAKINLSKYLGYTPSVSKMKTPKINRKYLRLSRLIAHAKRGNPSLRNLMYKQKISSIQIDQERSKMYPTLDLEASANLSHNQHGIRGLDKNYRAGLTFHYNLFNGFKDRTSIEQAKLRNIKSRLSIQSSKREIVAAVKRSYEDYNLFHQKFSAVKQHIASARKTEKLYKKEEEETGDRSIIDILNIRQEANFAEVEKIDTYYTMLQYYVQLLANSSDLLSYLHVH